MKILHVIPSVAAVRGGPSQAIIQMVSALRAQNVDAEIATTNDNGETLLDVSLNQRIDYQQVPVYFFPRFSPPIRPIREFAFSSAMTTWLWKSVVNYDLVHVHGLFCYPSSIAMTIARQQSIPYIVRPFGILCKWSLQQSKYKKKLYLDLIERQNLNHSQALHFTALQEQEEVSELNLSPPGFIAPLGLNTCSDIFNARQKLREWLNIPPAQPVILFMSRLHPKKGLDYLIPALSQHKDKNFTFVIAGSGSAEYEIEIDQWISEYGIEHLTKRVGFVHGEVKQLLLQGSDLFALTSHSENFGVVVIEALASGLPVLLTPGVALSSIVSEQKLGYVVPLCINDIASALTSFFSFPEEVVRMGSDAKKYVRREYSWNKISSQIKDIYDEILTAK